jgi:chromosome segregation ATPase
LRGFKGTIRSTALQKEFRREAVGSVEDNSLQKQRVAVERALAGTVPLHEHNATCEALEHAEQHSAQLKEQNEQLVEEVGALTQELSRTQNEARSLQEGKEVSDATITGLEAILQKIEKQVGCGGKSRGQEDVQLATLSRQIVNAKLAEADAQRRVKVAARQELDHRQKIAVQSERISALKVSLAEARKEVVHLRSQASHASKSTSSHVATGKSSIRTNANVCFALSISVCT